MTTRIANFETVGKDTSKNAFAALLATKENNILRDSFIYINPEQGDSKRLMMGYTIIYPACRSNGHEHGDREEAYYVTRGKGVMVIDGEEFTVSAGDCFYVPFGKFHTIRNPHNEPLEYVWAIAIDR